eukprot:TRINITY_DN29819_c0_g1_i1.p1 TRINITY_DN29819_c0_g1~~TRINITY_DN29819_c0_g1_i1.p1  ORF type:complete len:188 (+),score=38.60 TRINITY_DN29819_c0_g1_i1:104-667(+)
MTACFCISSSGLSADFHLISLRDQSLCSSARLASLLFPQETFAGYSYTFKPERSCTSASSSKEAMNWENINPSALLQHLEFESQILTQTHQSLSEELRKLQVEEEMYMRAFHDIFTAEQLENEIMVCPSDEAMKGAPFQEHYQSDQESEGISAARSNIPFLEYNQSDSGGISEDDRNEEESISDDHN